jgi:hypothetical protein
MNLECFTIGLMSPLGYAQTIQHVRGDGSFRRKRRPFRTMMTNGSKPLGMRRQRSADSDGDTSPWLKLAISE